MENGNVCLLYDVCFATIENINCLCQHCVCKRLFTRCIQSALIS